MRLMPYDLYFNYMKEGRSSHFETLVNRIYEQQTFSEALSMLPPYKTSDEGHVEDQ